QEVVGWRTRLPDGDLLYVCGPGRDQRQAPQNTLLPYFPEHQMSPASASVSSASLSARWRTVTPSGETTSSAFHTVCSLMAPSAPVPQDPMRCTNLIVRPSPSPCVQRIVHFSPSRALDPSSIVPVPSGAIVIMLSCRCQPPT